MLTASRETVRECFLSQTFRYFKKTMHKLEDSDINYLAVRVFKKMFLFWIKSLFPDNLLEAD